MELFGSPKKRKAEVKTDGQSIKKSAPALQEEDNNITGSSTTTGTSSARTFSELGLCDWICKSTGAMGFKRPFDIQKACIPSIIAGRDVMGCAETGSGKTAAFALPILQHLSQDPYGIFAIVLTPTRELAIQISEQFSALGAAMGVRIALVIGGQNMMAQASALAKKPHIVIATPGRLRHHLEGADPPNLSKALYLVLDEADRLLSAGFSSELKSIISSMHPKRQTLLFSATLTDSLVELEKLAARETLRFDLTSESSRVPSRLLQQYLFMPAQVKMCYLVAVLRKLFTAAEERAENKSDGPDDLGISAISALSEGKRRGKPNKKDKKGKDKGPKLDQSAKLLDYSIIIFVGTCRRCQEISETLQQLGVGCVALHGMLAQSKRMESLDAFKSHRSRILVATDVASRGLDIPAVDLVINMDLPKIVADYVHRVGRTARAGRGGRALSLITQYDVELVHAVEEYTGQKLTQSTEVVDDDVVPLLNSVSKAMRMAQLSLLEGGFDEKEEVILTRKKKQRKQLLRKAGKPESS